MENLKELIHIVSKSKVQSINIIGDVSFRQNTLLWKLYEGLLDGTITDDISASKALNLPLKGKQYSSVKSEFKSRVLDTIFFIDYKKISYTDSQKMYALCCKEWARIKILMWQGGKKTGISLAKKVLQNSLKYNFTEIAIDSARILRTHYGALLGNKKQFLYYNKILKENQDAWVAENTVHEYYIQVALEYQQSNHKEATRIALLYRDEIEEILGKFDSYRIHMYGNMVIMWSYMLNYDYVATIKSCDKAVLFFEQKDFNFTVHQAIFMFLQNKLACYIQLKNFEAGRDTALKCREIITTGTFNWFNTENLFIKIAFHSKHYQEAYRIFNNAINNSRFRFLTQVVKELWEIYGMYIHYLILLGFIIPDETDKRFNKIRLGKFLNTVPKHSKEKRRMNIPILIIHILFLLYKQEYDSVITRMEAIEKYCARYLKNDTNFRSNCFIKLLVQIPKSNFHVVAVERNTKKYWDKLLSVPLETANQTHEIEILPYEDLWEFVLQSLTMTPYRQKSKKR